MIKQLLNHLLKHGRSIDGLWLSTPEMDVLLTVVAGGSLRSHRDIEGKKHYELTNLSGEKTTVALKIVEKLRRKRLIETNHKFPSATYLLTGFGAQIGEKLHGNPTHKPLTARKFAERD